MKKSWIVIGLLTLTTGCQQTPEAPIEPKNAELTITVPEVKEAELARAFSQFDTQISNKACDDNSQCQVVGVGAQPCGGPSKYEVYSLKHNKRKQVIKQAAQLTVMQQRFNQQQQLAGICQVLDKPAAQCINNTCQPVR